MLYKDRIKKILQSALECGYYKKDSRYIQLSETAVNNILSMLDKLDETEILPFHFVVKFLLGLYMIVIGILNVNIVIL